MIKLTRLPLVALAAAMIAPLAGAQIDLPVADDINPDPDIVEINLEASETTWEFLPGVQTTVWAYNGTVPGPTIEASFGNTLIVHFTNNLSTATTVHWHGLELPAGMDGSHIAQLLVQPGETFDYEFDLNQYGLYWYHPHVRTYDAVERGLHGALLIRGPVRESAAGVLGIDEQVMIFDDILLDANGEIVDAFSYTDPLENVLYQLNGRVGNYLLVNGKEAATQNLDMTNGEPQRWRIVNVANTTFARLDVADEQVGNIGQLYQIGSDGGLNNVTEIRQDITDGDEPHPQTTGPGWREGIILTPGERGDYIFVPHGPQDSTFKVLWKDWIRGRHIADYDGMGGIMLPDDPLDGSYPELDWLNITLIGPDPGAPYFKPKKVMDPTLDFIDPTTATATMAATMGHSVPTPEGDVIFFAQAEMILDSAGNMVMNPLPAAKITSDKAQDVNVGDIVQWEVTNLTHGDHPFHTHGFFFIPYEIEYFDMDTPGNNVVIPLTIVERKDTFRLPARTGLKMRSSTVMRAMMEIDDTGRKGLATAQGELPTRYPDGTLTSGGWLFHCHVLEHSGKGMLSFFEVHDPADPFWLTGRSNDGTYGKASLTGGGPLTAGSTVTVDLVDALENTAVVLVAGTSALNIPIVGGTLVPALESLFYTSTDASGEVQWTLPWDGAITSGSTVYLQAITIDPLAPSGYAFSNAIQINVP
ncbi:MAG: FtsP/CotA-like multicopper oxidase with cupredoxin domain [Planctomycetota bacterium]|jgi:FtsP/CotA-like multicopper oxidase with cupredoxin domain